MNNNDDESLNVTSKNVISYNNILNYYKKKGTMSPGTKY